MGEVQGHADIPLCHPGRRGVREADARGRRDRGSSGRAERKIEDPIGHPAWALAGMAASWVSYSERPGNQ